MGVVGDVVLPLTKERITHLSATKSAWCDVKGEDGCEFGDVGKECLNSALRQLSESLVAWCEHGESVALEGVNKATGLHGGNKSLRNISQMHQ
jgi:hypothetical protein